jgi:serine/threonine protein kinase
MMSCCAQVVYSYLEGLQWCTQIAAGLAFLHAQTPCIIHRDVKLENVLLSKGTLLTGPDVAEVRECFLGRHAHRHCGGAALEQKKGLDRASSERIHHRSCMCHLVHIYRLLCRQQAPMAG